MTFRPLVGKVLGLAAFALAANGAAAWAGTGTTPPTPTTTCPSGSHWNGKECEKDAPPPPPVCTGGKSWNGSACVCASGTTFNGSSCVMLCPPGAQLVGGNCVYPEKPEGPQAVAPTPAAAPKKAKSDAPASGDALAVDYSERAAQAIPVGGVGRLDGTPDFLQASLNAENPYGYQNVQVAGNAAARRESSTRLFRFATVGKTRDAAPMASHSPAVSLARPEARAAAAREVAAPPATPRLASVAPELTAVPMNAKIQLPPRPTAAPATPEERATQQVKEGVRAFTLRHEWAEAAERAADALRSEPGNADAEILLSNASRKLARCQEAEAHGRAAVTLAPGRSDAHKALARALQCLNRVDEAVKEIELALKLSPNDADGRQLLGFFKDMQGARVAALQHLEEAARLDPRRQAQLAAARRGAALRDVELHEDLAQLADGELQRSRRGAGRGWATVAGATASAAAVVGLILWRRRKDFFAAPATVVKPSAPKPGNRLVDKYDVLRVLARGSGAEFLEVRDKQLGRTVALRRLPAHQDDEKRSELLRAARASGALRHQNLLDVYEAVEDGDDICVVFEWVRGKTAARLVAESRRLPLSEALAILEPVCEAVEFSHSRSLARGRIALDCIVLTEQGPTKLADLDVVMSAGSAGVDADVRALGGCLYHLVTGVKPGAGDLEASKRAPGLPLEVDRLLADAAASQGGVMTAAGFLERLRALRPISPSMEAV